MRVYRGWKRPDGRAEVWVDEYRHDEARHVQCVSRALAVPPHRVGGSGWEWGQPGPGAVLLAEALLYDALLCSLEELGPWAVSLAEQFVIHWARRWSVSAETLERWADYQRRQGEMDAVAYALLAGEEEETEHEHGESGRLE